MSCTQTPVRIKNELKLIKLIDNVIRNYLSQPPISIVLHLSIWWDGLIIERPMIFSPTLGYWSWSDTLNWVLRINTGHICMKLECQHHSTRSMSALDDLLALESEHYFVLLTIEIWGEMELYSDKWTKLKNKNSAKNNTKWVASIPSTYVKIWYAVGNRYVPVFWLPILFLFNYFPQHELTYFLSFFHYQLNSKRNNWFSLLLTFLIGKEMRQNNCWHYQSTVACSSTIKFWVRHFSSPTVAQVCRRHL